MSKTEGYRVRQVALEALRAVRMGAFADVALDRTFQSTPLSVEDRRLATELVYGCVRRQRTLDALVTQFARKPSDRQPPDLRLILHLGLYQLRYLDQVPAAAAVHTTVELTKHNGLKGLDGFVNGLLRQYERKAIAGDPLQLPESPTSQLAVLHSYPDWIVQLWLDQIGFSETAQLCAWLNRPPHLDLRINPRRTTLEEVQQAFHNRGMDAEAIAGLPQALRLSKTVGAIPDLPGFAAGWWSVQESSAQLVSHLLNPQPGETVIDACAAPGGKTTHIAELMGDRGVVWGCDRYASRLKKITLNRQRLGLNCIKTQVGDSRQLPQFEQQADRVLVDAPCSGLGTLHRHADARWRQTPETVAELAQLQAELLRQASTWVKPQGRLVYATCTLHPQENEAVIQAFLAEYPQWQLQPPAIAPELSNLITPDGWIKIWNHRQDMDGFFVAILQRQ